MTEIGSAGKILIVDDNEANVRLLDVYLRAAGYTTEKAYDGEQALEQVRAVNPDLVLLDVMMPRLDGYEVCRRLRADEATNVVPVVMITALKDTEDRIRGIEAGADDFISKPFDKAELLARVKNLLRIKYYRSMVAERRKLDAVIEDISHGIIITGPDFSVTLLNHRARVLLGRENEDCLGRKLFELFGGFRVRPPAGELLAPGKRTVAVNLERENVSPGVYLIGRLTRITDTSGVMSNVAFVFRDASEERRKEKLQRDFLSLVSHKLKTPLTIVSGYLSLINVQKYGPLNAEQAKALKLVESRVGELKGLIEKLLQYAGLSAEELRHEAGVVDLAAAAERAEARIAQRYGAGHVAFENEVTAGLPKVLVEVEHLALVLDNLLDNAVKFTTGPGAARVRLGARQTEDGMVEVTVQDFGPGISLSHQTDIFSDFLQVEESFTGNVGGLGLGLPTAKRLVESWGGTIAVQSKPGEGASFVFTIPVVGPAAGEKRTGGPGMMETA
jgi:signal transduction histidine kinase